ncbi:MAG TPA: flagellar FliJ family protein [Actinotalea sp.]|jgi:flagellar FliJ protein
MSTPFRLGGLLRLRRLQEDEAAADLAQANARRQAAEQRRLDTEEMLAGTVLPHRTDLLTWQASIAGRAALTGLVQEASLTVAVAASRAERAGEVWSDARARAVTLGKLEDRHTAEVRTQEDRLEQQLLDEAAARGHQAAQGRVTEEEDR